MIRFLALNAVITINGPNAQSVADTIAGKLNLTANNLVTSNLHDEVEEVEEGEEPLPLPVMNFLKESKEKLPERKEAASDAEEVLALPTWNFAPA